MTQEKIADSWIQIEQFRLLVLRTAWLIDKHHDYQKVRRDIAAVKVAMPQVLHDVAQRALHLHGALGVSDEMPFVKMMVAAESLGIADGATELHKMTVARRTLREYRARDNAFPVPAHTDPAGRSARPGWLNASSTRSRSSDASRRQKPRRRPDMAAISTRATR